MRPHATHVVCTPGLFYDTMGRITQTDAYPLQEISDYLRSNPSKENAVQGTLSYFDLRWFGSRVKANTLVMAEGDGQLFDTQTLGSLINSLGGAVDVHKTDHSNFKDNVFIENWVTRQLGLKEPVLPTHWRT